MAFGFLNNGTYETGTWAIEYNAENRPVRWTNAATGTVITMAYDSQGRRVEYKSVTNGTQNTWLRFLYDGYLCIPNSPYNTFKEFVWDPTEPVATRPLVFRYAPNSLNLFYAFDGNKNVSDVFYRLTANGIGAHYDYAPFGATTRTHRDSSALFDIVSLNPFRFSSEYYDSELDLIYYNYRHNSPALGRFLSRDPIEEQGGLNLYAFVRNSPITGIDYLGKWLGGTHRQLTYDALSRIRLFVGVISLGKSLVIVSKLKDTLIEKIVDANVATDSGDYKNKQNYHYCADRDADWTVDYAKSVYSETLAQEKKNFLEIISANQNDKESCLVALEYLGRLCHMWQDYYAHGVEKDDSWFGADIGTIKGNPNSPTMIPVSYGTLGFVGGHGGFFRLMNPFSNVEPGDRADDAETRRSQAERFTNKEAFPLLLEWFKSCKCVYSQM